MEDSTFPIPNLPNDVIIEILTWLPVKPLLKFKSVCKSWRALISTPQFIKSHLENSKLDPNSTKQRLLMKCRGNSKQLSVNSMLHETVSEAFDLSSPFRSSSTVTAVLGSCNGLLCLMAGFRIPEYDYYFYRIELILWNPSTRIRKELPDFEPNAFPSFDIGFNDYGFGYDKSSDDYKVVRFFRGDMDSSEPEGMMQVYSLRNDQWKTAKPFRIRPLQMSHFATFVNGKLYWMASKRIDDDHDENCVFCFDLETEEHEILQFPNGLDFHLVSFLNMWLVECGGSLRLMSFCPFGSDVWSFDGCGVGNEKWEKVGRVQSVKDEDNCGFCLCVLYVMNNPVIFLAGGSIAIFDAKDGSIRYHKIRDTGDFTVRCAYIESLVSPLGW